MFLSFFACMLNRQAVFIEPAGLYVNDLTYQVRRGKVEDGVEELPCIKMELSTLHLVSCIQYWEPSTLTQHSAPSTLHLVLGTQYSASSILCLVLYTLYPAPSTLHLVRYTLHSAPSTLPNLKYLRRKAKSPVMRQGHLGGEPCIPGNRTGKVGSEGAHSYQH